MELLEKKDLQINRLHKGVAWLSAFIVLLVGINIFLAVILLNNYKQEDFFVYCNGLEESSHYTCISVTLKSTNGKEKISAAEFAIKVNDSPMETSISNYEITIYPGYSETKLINFQNRIIIPSDTIQLYFRGQLIATL